MRFVHLMTLSITARFYRIWLSTTKQSWNCPNPLDTINSINDYLNYLSQTSRHL